MSKICYDIQTQFAQLTEQSKTSEKLTRTQNSPFRISHYQLASNIQTSQTSRMVQNEIYCNVSFVD